MCVCIIDSCRECTKSIIEMTENDDNRQSAFYFNKEEGKNTHKSTRRSARFLHNKQFDLKSSKEKNTHKKHKCNAGPTKRNETETLIRVMFASWTGQLYTHSFAYRWETWNGTKECKYSSFSYKMDYLVTFFFQRNYTNRNPAKKDLRKKKIFCSILKSFEFAMSAIWSMH